MKFNQRLRIVELIRNIPAVTMAYKMISTTPTTRNSSFPGSFPKLENGKWISVRMCDHNKEPGQISTTSLIEAEHKTQGNLVTLTY